MQGKSEALENQPLNDFCLIPLSSIVSLWYQSFPSIKSSAIIISHQESYNMAKDGEKKTLMIEPHSPYYLHPSEGPGMLTTAEVFDGKNYELWENAVRIAVKAKNRLGFIDGTLRNLKSKTVISPNTMRGMWLTF